MIQFSEVTRRYGTTVAVDGLTFEVRRGEVLGLLGPNGAGKTTTLKMLTGYMYPTSGTISVDGLDAVDDSLAVRRKLGYLPENSPLYPEMEVRDYLDFIAQVRRMPPGERGTRFREVSEICGLGPVLTKPIGALSKGYRQRVGLAQAIMHDPAVLVLDEPTSGLDPNQIIEIRHLIRQLGREKTVILSTHILSEVQAACDRVVIVHRGRKAADGSPEELTAGSGSDRIVLELEGAPENPNDAWSDSGLPMLEPLGNSGRFQIVLGGRGDIRAEVFRAVVERGWTLLEMRTERSSLEDVFRELTRETGKEVVH